MDDTNLHAGCECCKWDLRYNERKHILQGQVNLHHGGGMDEAAVRAIVTDIYRHIAQLQVSVERLERHTIADTEALLERVRELQGQM